IEGDELGVHQHGARGVLAVVDQGIAVAVEDFGGARFAHAQPRPDDDPAKACQPPFVALSRVRRAGHDSATDHSHMMAAPPRPKITVDSAMRAGVARPVKVGSRVSRYSPPSSHHITAGFRKAPSPRRSRTAGWR